MTTDIETQLRALIGFSGPADTGPYDVGKPMISHWCEAMEDPNPAYLDEEYAKESHRGQIIAPPAAIQVWTMPVLWPGGQTKRWYPEPDDEVDTADPQLKVLDTLDRAGFTGVMATNTSIETIKPVHVGDRISVKREFSEFSPLKTTRAGTGYFVTFLRTYTNQKNELIGKQTFTIFKFKKTEA